MKPSSKNQLSDLKVIGLGLALLYATSLFVLLAEILKSDLQVSVVILAILLGILFSASIAAVRLVEFGRLTLVVANGLMGLYLLVSHVAIRDLIPLAFIIMNFVIFLFYNQPKIKTYFLKTKKGEWKSVLIVDDDESLVKIVRPILINNGYSVLTATTGEEGLQIAFNQKPDLVILDVILPGIKGRDLCKQIKSDVRTKDTPVVFLTAKDSPDDEKAEKAAGAYAHLTKPVVPKVLLETVQEAIAAQ